MDKAVKHTAIFGLGATSLSAFSSKYIQWLKAKKQPLPNLHYLGSGSNYIKSSEGRLVLIDSVAILFSNLKLFHKDDRIIVADSPLLLMEIPNIEVLDLSENAVKAGSYLVGKFNPTKFHSSLKKSLKVKNDFATLNWERLDQLGLIVDTTTSGVIASPIRSITAQLDHRQRIVFRQEIAKWLQKKQKLKDLLDHLAVALGKSDLATALFNDFKKAATENEAVIQEAIAALIAVKSVKKILENSELTLFELKFLNKMLKNKA